MEDIFQIIIILFFILSSVASSLKKKKKQQEKLEKENPTPTQVKDVEPQRVKSVPQKSSSEMLEELLGFKIDLPEPQKQEAPKDFSEDSIRTEQTWDPVKDFNDAEIQNIEPTLKKVHVNEKEKYSSNFNDKVTTVSQNLIRKKSIPKNKYSKKIFSNSANLKDYIVIQEILNKPKALRR